MDVVNKIAIERVDRDKKAVPQGFATTVEAAQFLRLTRQAVSQFAHNGTIPAIRFGRALRIPWSWLYETEQRARQELPAPFPRKRAARGGATPAPTPVVAPGLTRHAKR